MRLYHFANALFLEALFAASMGSDYRPSLSQPVSRGLFAERLRRIVTLRA